MRTLPFSFDSASDSVAYNLVNTRMSESQAETEEQTNYIASSRSLRVLPFCLRPRQTGFYWNIQSDEVISGTGNSAYDPSVCFTTS